MAGIDYGTMEGRGLRLCYLVRCEYVQADQAKPGDIAVARWCGPQSKALSGLVSAADGTRHFWEPRIDGLEIDRDLGPLSNHVQTASSVSFRVRIGHDDFDGADPRVHRPDWPVGDDSPQPGTLLKDSQLGRWDGHRVDVWYAAVDESGVVVEIEHRFRGVMDRDPDRCGLERFSVIATEGLLGLAAKWPHTRFPLYPSMVWTDDATNTLVNWHNYHPGRLLSGAAGYAMTEDHAGRASGVLYGIAGNDDLIWQEAVFYGVNERPFTANGRLFFYHVSPQFNCYCHQLFLDDGAGNLIGWGDSSTSPDWVESFNNYDPTMGPLGTNVVLRATDTTPLPIVDPKPKAYMQVSGPGAGLPSPTVIEGGAIEALSLVYGFGTIFDYKIVEDIFSGADMLDLGPDVFGSGALLDWAAAPVGPVGLSSYRQFHCAVPLSIADEMPLVREVVGELMAELGSDLVQKFDPVGGEQRLYPIRRRPNPVTPDPQHTIRSGDLLRGHMGTLPGWQISDDPDGHYVNKFRGRSATWNTQAQQSPTFAEVLLAPETRDGAEHDDVAEQGDDARAAVVERSFDGRFWVQNERGGGSLGGGGGLQDAIEFMGSERSQPQKAVEIDLGLPAMAIQLADAVAYDLAGLFIGTGHARKLIEQPDVEVVRLTSYHAKHFESAPSGGALPGA